MEEIKNKLIEWCYGKNKDVYPRKARGKEKKDIDKSKISAGNFWRKTNNFINVEDIEQS